MKNKIIVLLAGSLLASFTAAKAASYSLVFATNNYTSGSMTVSTASGNKTVNYRYYKNIVYVANPVDTNYETMNVFVPTNIAGVNVSTTNVPILLDINVGGYTSSAAGSNPSSDGSLAVAAGYVVVEPGCRGRDNYSASLGYYGKAPAAMVDLKSVVRYIRYNAGVFPGNVNWIISSGSSAGGALSALLGASGDSSLYSSYLQAVGAATNVSDSIYAAGVYCPIMNLDHADMCYEYEFGTIAMNGSNVNQTLSGELKSAFTNYQNGLACTGKNGFGIITASNFETYILNIYLIPSANQYLQSLSASSLTSYLSGHTWITWSNNTAAFTYTNFAAYIGRSKSLPAFDAFDLSTAECIEFGNTTTNARHFTDFSLQYASGNSAVTVDTNLQTVVNMMNPMYFIGLTNSGCAKYWWVRHGTKDTDTSRMVIIDLAASLENQGKSVDTWLYWDGAHGANDDPGRFVNWMGDVISRTNFQVIAISRQTNDVALAWSTYPGLTNFVQAASSLGGTNVFTTISSQIVPAGFGAITTNYTDAGGATNGSSRFYRIIRYY